MTHPSLIKLRNRIYRSTHLRLGIPPSPRLTQADNSSRAVQAPMGSAVTEMRLNAPIATTQDDPIWDFLNTTDYKERTDHAST